MQKRKAYTQTMIGIAIVIGLFIFGSYTNTLKETMGTYLFAGVLLGYSLTRSRFGFAGGVKRIYMRGESSLTTALVLLVGVTTLVFMGIQWKAAMDGAVPAYMAAEGEAIIPGTQNVYFTNLATIIGGVVFGIGMMLAGGCGSGTLADFGEGQGRAFIAFIFFVLAAAPGHWARQVFDRTALGQIGIQLHFPQVLGYMGSFILTIVLLGAIYWIGTTYEKKRKAEHTAKDPMGDYEEYELPYASEGHPFFSYPTYHKLFVERWDFLVGASAIAFGAIFVMVTTGKAWGVSTPLVTLDVAILQKFGMTFSEQNFGSHLAKIDAGLLSDGGTVRNIGLFFGSMLAFLMAHRFKIDFDFSVRDGLYYALGGLMLGFGSRFGLGCNIGAMYSAISNFSISGWIFLLAMVAGGIIGLKAFGGKVNILPIPDHIRK